jgi:hypothetical protein
LLAISVLLRSKPIPQGGPLRRGRIRLARDYERLPTTLAGLHVVAFASFMLRNAAALVAVHDSL